MGRRHAAVALGLLVLVGTLAGMKAAQIGRAMAAGRRAEKAGPPPETVGTFVAQKQEWDETLHSVGSVATARGVSIANDAPGIVTRIAFVSGGRTRRGQLLVELDSKVERAQLAAAHARRKLAAANAARMHLLFNKGAASASQRDLEEANHATAQADVSSLAAQVERKTVRAPFDGKLGIRLVNVGQYLPSGTPITSLESEEATYVDFSLPQKNLAQVDVGMPVRLLLDSGRTLEGTLSAIDPEVDPVTRNIKLRASVPARSNELRPGMFAQVSVVKPTKLAVVAVPATAIVHAPHGDSLFIVEGEGADKTVRQQFVRLGGARGDFLAVTEGVQPGQEVVIAGAFKLRNRMRVAVNNQVPLRPQLAPRPPNR